MTTIEYRWHSIIGKHVYFPMVCDRWGCKVLMVLDEELPDDDDLACPEIN